MNVREFNALIRAPWIQTTHRGIDYSGTPVDPLPKPVCEVFSGGLGIEGANAAQQLIGAAPQLLETVDAAFEEIGALHKAFGAPGDYGYETREGAALFRIYQFQRQLLDALIAAGVDRFSNKVTS